MKLDVEEFLTDLITRHCKVSLKINQIVILESLLYPRPFVECLTEVLFTRFKLTRLYFFPRNILPLYPFVSTSGVVVDCGYLMTEVTPVVASYYSSVGTKTSSMAGRRVEQVLLSLLTDDGNASLSPAQVEDVKVRAAKVLTRRQAQTFLRPETVAQLKQATRPIQVCTDRNDKMQLQPLQVNVSYLSRVLPFEMFFDEDEEDNLVKTILEALLEVGKRTNLD